MPDASLFKPLGLLVRKNFFDAGLCANLRSEMLLARRQAAPVSENGVRYVDPATRKSAMAQVSDATTSLVKSRLLDLTPELEQHFEVSLTECRLPQFLVYGPGDFFAAHRDTGVDPAKVSKPNQRQVSVVIFLNSENLEPREGSYGGGRLRFFGLLKDPRARMAGLPLEGEEGLLIAFRSSITHEVLPISHGERYTIVTWYS